VGYAGIVQDRSRRRNLLIALLLTMGALIGVVVVTSPRPAPPEKVEKHPGPDKPPPAPMPPPPPVDKAALDSTIDALDRWLTSAATNSNDFTVLLHALRGLGPDHPLSGKTTRQVLLERLPNALLLQDGKLRLSPLQSSVPDFELLAVLLESDLPLEQPLLENVSVGSWLEQARQSIAMPRGSDWYSINWSIDVLALAASREAAVAPAARQKLQDLAVAGFQRLSTEHGVFGKWAGKGALAALEAPDTLAQMRQQQLGPYALEGWGLPLAQSVLRAVAALNQSDAPPKKEPNGNRPLDDAARALLGQLVVRQLFERQLWVSKEPLSSATLVDQLGYCGRELEALAWARLAILSSSPQERRDEIAPTLRDCVSSINKVIVPLRFSDPAARPQEPAQPTQLGPTELQRSAEAVSQALRGLRMVRRAYWPRPD
jgi:hypothetical protein